MDTKMDRIGLLGLPFDKDWGDTRDDWFSLRFAMRRSARNDSSIAVFPETRTGKSDLWCDAKAGGR